MTVTLYELGRDGLVAAIRTVETNPQVPIHGRVRVIADWTTYLNEFVSAHRPQGWWVTRGPDGPPAWSSMGPTPTVERTWQYEVRGILAVKDTADTETEWQNKSDAVLSAIDRLDRLGSDVRYEVGGVGPSYRRALDIRQFGSALCHYVEIVVPVTVIETLS